MSTLAGNTSNFDFIKKDFTEHFNHGTIVGFSSNMDEIWSKKPTKDAKKEKKLKPASLNITPNNTNLLNSL